MMVWQVKFQPIGQVLLQKAIGWDINDIIGS